MTATLTNFFSCTDGDCFVVSLLPTAFLTLSLCLFLYAVRYGDLGLRCGLANQNCSPTYMKEIITPPRSFLNFLTLQGNLFCILLLLVSDCPVFFLPWQFNSRSWLVVASNFLKSDWPVFLQTAQYEIF